ncbi:TetR/AcrR family transcriptional regulator [Auraticoccus cholistanensis]|nr:TetR/AcrR family transcriptional regulator [Auraticoccus cholistanensis]
MPDDAVNRQDPTPEEPAPADPREWGTPEGRHMIELLWNPPGPAGRGPRQRLSLDRVVETAMALAARDGFEALSMRRLAAELGVGAMSLYTYVPGRDELFELMIDRAWGDRGRADPSRPWREQVEQVAEEAWAMYQRHGWLVSANLARLPLGPNVLDAQEDLYRAVALTGLPHPDVVRVTGAVEAHVFGAARAAVVDTRQATATGVSYDGYWESRSSFWGTYYTPERFPTMTAIWESGGFDEVVDNHADMRFGLRMLLDGVELAVRRAAGTPPA